jgi:hypothetical protein
VKVAETGKVTAADVARLADVTRATVSNWRRRHADFPEPSGGTDASPAFDLEQVEAWLARRGRLPERSPEQRLWRRIREVANGADATYVLLRCARCLLWLHRTGDPSAVSGIWQPGLSERQIAEVVSERVARATADVPDPYGFAAGLDEAELALLPELADLVTRQGARPVFESLLAHHLGSTGVRSIATPEPVADLMLSLADVAGTTVFDPACGSGELLVAAQSAGAERVTGQERSNDFGMLAAIRLAISGGGDPVEVRIGDSLRSGDFGDLQAGTVVCHPPFGDREWGHEELVYDARWEYGLPPKSEPELAWVQHALAHLTSGGRAIFLLPPATSARSSGRRIRAELLRRGALRAVVALPPGAASPHHVGLHLWLLERPVTGAVPPRSVLFVDTEAEASREGGRTIDWPALHHHVVGVWRVFNGAQDGPALPSGARAVPVIDLLDDVVDVTPARNVAQTSSEESPEAVAAALDRTRSRLREILEDLPAMLPGDDWTPGKGADDEWRTTTVGDLLRSGSLWLHRASPAAPRTDDTETDGGLPVLTLADVEAHGPPSGVTADDFPEPGQLQIEAGDVVLPAAVTGSFAGRVVSDADEGAVLGRHLHLLRPDPERIDPWFLVGFLAARPNVKRASYGSSIIRLDPRRLQIPLLPLDDQRRYAEAFRALDAFGVAARQAVRLGQEATFQLRDALTSGSLRPS